MIVHNISELVNLPCTYSSPSGHHTGHFAPRGNPCYGGKRLNPVGFRTTDPPYCARLLVGFNVGPKPKWKMNHLITFVKAYLREQDLPEDASFVYQKGVYTHSENADGTGKKTVVTENGAQVVLLRLPGTNWDRLRVSPPYTQFQDFCYHLAEYLCDKMTQKEIIVQISKGGDEIETRGMIGHKPLPKNLFP